MVAFLSPLIHPAALVSRNLRTPTPGHTPTGRGSRRPIDVGGMPPNLLFRCRWRGRSPWVRESMGGRRPTLVPSHLGVHRAFDARSRKTHTRGWEKFLNPDRLRMSVLTPLSSLRMFCRSGVSSLRGRSIPRPPETSPKQCVGCDRILGAPSGLPSGPGFIRCSQQSACMAAFAFFFGLSRIVVFLQPFPSVYFYFEFGK